MTKLFSYKANIVTDADEEMLKDAKNVTFMMSNGDEVGATIFGGVSITDTSDASPNDNLENFKL